MNNSDFNKEEITETIDEWAAEKCGVHTINSAMPCWLDPKKKKYAYWSIKKADCREIVREHYQITTEYYCGKWIALRSNGVEKPPDMGWGITIGEAELACITAIYEAENGSENK